MAMFRPGVDRHQLNERKQVGIVESVFVGNKVNVTFVCRYSDTIFGAIIIDMECAKGGFLKRRFV